MVNLALTDADNKVLADIQHYTTNLATKVEALGVVDGTNTIQAKALKDEATGLEKMVENMRTAIV